MHAGREDEHISRYLLRRQLVPTLVEQCCDKILGRFESLIEFLRGQYLVDQRLRHRFPGTIVFRIILRHFRQCCPHFIDLRWEFDKKRGHLFPEITLAGKQSVVQYLAMFANRTR